jgi:hypothetical protein
MESLLKEVLESNKQIIKEIRELKEVLINQPQKDPKEIMNQLFSAFPPEIRKHFIKGDS